MHKKCVHKHTLTYIYIHMINIVIFQLGGTLRVITYYHAPQLTFTVVHSIDTHDPMVTISLLAILFPY
jgi:hypothetical protein